MSTEYSNMAYSARAQFPGMNYEGHNFINGSCSCPECYNYMQWAPNSIVPETGAPMPQPGSNIPSMVQKGAPRRYTHNPYASGPTYPAHMNSSVPPIVSPTDDIARIVPNVSEYDMYPGSNYMLPNTLTPMPQIQIPHAHHSGSLQDQFMGSIGALSEAAYTSRGRSMLQGILRLGQPEHIKQICNELTVSESETIRMMLDVNACHVIRALLEVVDVTYLRVLASPSIMTEAHILQLATSTQHTRRILQTLFEHFSTEPCCDGIAAVLARHAQYLATTQQGCIALMRVIDNAQPITQRNLIHEHLFPAMVSLMTDPFGNYVIQHTMERGDHQLVATAVRAYFIPNVVHLCCNKFASNVMEKVLYNINQPTRRALIESLLNDTVALQSIMNDGYGNFVIQAIIDSSTNYQEFRRVSERVRSMIHTSPYGHKIEAKIRNKRMSRTFMSNNSCATSVTSSACNTAPSTPRGMKSMQGMHPVNMHPPAVYGNNKIWGYPQPYDARDFHTLQA